MTARIGVAMLGAWALTAGVSGCGAQRPVLYPNAHYEQVGAARADRDVEDCMARAKAYVDSGGAASEKAGQVAKETAIGAGSGAAIGAVGGAISGGAGQGAAIGAATGATAGLLHGMWGAFGSSEPDPMFANFVNRCLSERGYESIGWK